MIIAFTGYARHGKTTCANYLRDAYGFRTASFAESLKKLCYDGLVKFPPPVGAEDRFEGWDSDIDYWQSRIWEDRSPFSRWLLQFVGTEIGRALYENVWVERTMDTLRRDQDYAFGDLRFPNEASALRHAGGIVIRVLRIAPEGVLYRDPTTDPTHESEKQSASISADATLAAKDVPTLLRALDAYLNTIPKSKAAANG